MSERKDLKFLKEIKQRFKRGVDGNDRVEIEYVEKMLNDWIYELEEKLTHRR